MSYWADFDNIFSFNKKYHYESKTVELIVSNRRVLDNQLFADRLLGLLGIKGVTKVYPPKTNSDLRSLVDQIVSSEAAAQFANSCHFPEKYRLFIEGVWHMDRLDFRGAIEYLAEPSLIPTFPDEILYTLTLPHIPKHDDSLAIAYYLTAAPPLATEKVQRAYFETLARSGVTEAFFFTRKYDEFHRHSFFVQLIEFVLKTSPGQTRSKRAMELVGLPLDEDEEAWFQESLLRGAASHFPGAKDTLMMRCFATGKMDALAAELETLGGKKVEGLNWDDLRESVRSSGATPAQ
ncbi:hypothetical protein N7470_005456 [Penicillium chermesinum]|nr:hypothetical protein N7470_005456 [Penicillium chermesinum]